MIDRREFVSVVAGCLLAAPPIGNAQQAVRNAVERAYPERRRRQAEHGLDAPAHLSGGLVGEGDREDAVRRDVLDLHQPGDPVREHAGLAATGAREHQRRRERRGDGLTLRVIERIEEVADVHWGAGL